MASRLRRIGGDGHLVANNRVDQRGFAGIRSADECHESAFKRISHEKNLRFYDQRHEAESYIRGTRPTMRRQAKNAALALARLVFIGVVRAPFPIAVAYGGALVGFHDSSNKGMPDDVATGKGAKRDILDAIEDTLHAFQA